MLYPLSYEGLRPISYLAGDIHECPGVPWGAHRCHRVCVAVAPSLVGGYAEQISGTRGAACPSVTAGAQRWSRVLSTRRAHPEHSPRLLSWENVFAADLMFARGHAIVSCTGTAGCASCGSDAGHLAHEVPGAWLLATTAATTQYHRYLGTLGYLLLGLGGPQPPDRDVLGVGAIHYQNRLPRAPGPWRRVINTQDVDGLATGFVAQVRDADEVTVAGRADCDEPTARGDIKDLVDKKLHCRHGSASDCDGAASSENRACQSSRKRAGSHSTDQIRRKVSASIHRLRWSAVAA
jgi:hypothetical protein